MQVLLPINLLDSKGYQVTKLLGYHSGAVVGLITSPLSHVVITAGADGTVRAFDYRYGDMY